MALEEITAVVWVIREVVAGKSTFLGRSFLCSRFRNSLVVLLSLVVSHFQNYQQEPCQSHVYEEPQAYHRHHHCINCKYGAHNNLQLFKSGLTTGKCQQLIAVFRPACTQLCAWKALSCKTSVSMVLCEVRREEHRARQLVLSRQQEKLSRQFCLASKCLSQTAALLAPSEAKVWSLWLLCL